MVEEGVWGEFEKQAERKTLKLGKWIKMHAL